jgi:hypothetical protein
MTRSRGPEVGTLFGLTAAAVAVGDVRINVPIIGQADSKVCVRSL